MRYRVSDEELLDELERLAEELGRTPGVDDMDERGEFSHAPYLDHFGTWAEALQKVGLEPNVRRHIPDEELINELCRIAEIVGRTPKVDDMREKGEFSYMTYFDRFGSWNNAVGKLDMEPNSHMDIPEEDLLEELLRLESEAEKGVTPDMMREQGKYSINPYKNKFGSWSKAKDAAGIDHEEVYWGPMGEDHPHWTGGSSDYFGPKWPEQREKCLERDDHECQSCGDGDRLIDVHHITPRACFTSVEAANRLQNLVALCRSCHKSLEGEYILDTADEFKQKV